MLRILGVLRHEAAAVPSASRLHSYRLHAGKQHLTSWRLQHSARGCAPMQLQDSVMVCAVACITFGTEPKFSPLLLSAPSRLTSH